MIILLSRFDDVINLIVVDIELGSGLSDDDSESASIDFSLN